MTESSLTDSDVSHVEITDADVERDVESVDDVTPDTERTAEDEAGPELASQEAEAHDADVTADEVEGLAEPADTTDVAFVEGAAGDTGDIDESGDSGEPEADVDPIEEFRRALQVQLGDWYVVHSYAGYENRVKANLESRTTSLNMEDYIFQVEVPTEDVVEIKNGQRKNVRRNKFPGYVLVRMELSDDSWGAVRHTPGVTGFVGHAHQPTPLTVDEVIAILGPDSRDQGEVGGRDRRPGLRRRRLGHRGRRAVRDAAGHHPRDQPRHPAGQGARRDLRPGDPGRAGVQPDPEELTARTPD